VTEIGSTTVSSNAALQPGARATFYGTAYHKVSGRNQVAIPKNMKRAMDEAQEGPLLLMRLQNETFLRLYTKKQFDRKLDEVKQNEQIPMDSRSAVVDYMARAAEPVEPDSQGRFVIPAKWMESLGIRDEVAFCGAFTFIKVWPAEMQRESEEREQQKLAAVAAQVSNILDM
jgi:MraZ protein